MLFLNITMIMVTPFVGSHYFVDIVAGIAVAWLAILASKRIVGRQAG